MSDQPLEIVIQRVLDTPREQVFKAWTEPKQVTNWWPPKGFKTKLTELDMRSGGAWRYVMTRPDGTEYPVQGVFREVNAPERIVTNDDVDKKEETDSPRGTSLAITFEEKNHKTNLTLRITHGSVEDRRKHEEMGVVAGWESNLDRLVEHLAAT